MWPWVLETEATKMYCKAFENGHSLGSLQYKRCNKMYENMNVVISSAHEVEKKLKGSYF